jgi:large repetitive protein
VFGQTVTFTATVTPATATGNVTFKDGASTLGTVSLTSGTASLPISAMAVGSHNITAVYNGDSNYTTSTGTLTGNPQVVNQASTTTSVISSVNPSTFNQSVTFTATVAAVLPGAGLPTGNIQFMDGASPLGAPVILNGSAQATYTTASLSVGSHPITAVYSGDSSFLTSTSSSLSQTVQGADVAVSLMHSPDPAHLGGKLTFTATVINNGPSSTNVTFQETFAGTYYVVSSTTTQGSCSGTGPVNCDLGTMTNGQSAMITIVVTPYQLTRTIVATATATSSVTDSNPGNNIATGTAQVRFLPARPLDWRAPNR